MQAEILENGEAESFFKADQIWETSYGKARVLRMHGDVAVFGILELSVEAVKCGYVKGDTFRAHPDDQSAPSPRTWELLEN